MRSATLEQLYRITVDLFSTPESAASFDIGAGLDWVDRVLPDFTAACRDAVVNGTDTIFGRWEEWLRKEAGPNSVAGIREAGEIDSYEWRKEWLRTLILTSKWLNAGRAYQTENARYAIADKVGGEAVGSLSMMPTAFWHDLVDTLSSQPSKASKAGSTIAVSFPLVLAERMVVAGDSIDVLLADFVLEARPYSGAAAYLAPDQIATRCLDGEFLSIFAQAMNQVSRFIAPEKLSSVRVRLAPRRPEDEVFFQKLVIRGPSGGGALAAGIYALHCGHKAIDRSLAISFALSRPGQSTPDGLCHAVGGAYEKVRGCAKDGVRKLLVADEQASQVSFYGRLQDVAIVGADGVSDAIAVIESAVVPDSPSAVTIADDGGVLALGSPLYVERTSDTVFREAIGRRPMIVLLKGARQIGKTSLLVRGVDHVRRRDIKLVYVDLQSMGRDSLRTQRDLFTSLARVFSRELKLDVSMDDIYDDRDGPNKNLENFLFKYALNSPVIWFMDEVDRLFEFDYYTDVFSLMRSWHNRRPVHPELGNLTLVLSYATETHLLIEDAYQSPFNVGVKVELEDFSIEQAAALNERLGRPLADRADVERLHKLVHGHPHLVCRGLSWMAHEHKSLTELTERAGLDNGPFGSHLRRLLVVAQNPDLLAAVQSMLDGGECKCKNSDAFLHLRSAGLVIGDDCSNAQIRCEIYKNYLRRHLPAPEPAPAPPAKVPFWQAIVKRR